MVRLSLLAVAAFCAVSTIDAQNAAVHAPSIPGAESREATPSAAKPASAPAAAKPAAAPAAAKPAVVPAAAKPAVAPAPAVAKPPVAPATPGSAPAKAPASPAAPSTGAAAGAATAPAPAPKAGSTLSPEKTWITYQLEKTSDAACWRRLAFGKSGSCGDSSIFDGKKMCWLQCPMDFPVQCGMECIRQNKDCKLHIGHHVSDVAASAVKAASGIYGAIASAAKGVTRGVNCARQLYDVTTRIYDVLDNLSATKQLQTREQLAKAVEQIDLVVYDLPLAVASCLGEDLGKAFTTGGTVLKGAETFLVAVIEKKITKEDIKTYAKYLNFLKWFSREKKALPEVTEADLITLAKDDYVCGRTLKKNLKSVEDSVKDTMKNQPKIDIEYLQYVVLNSDLVTKDLPAAAQSCAVDKATQDDIITTAQLLVDQIIASAFDDKGVIGTIMKYKLTIARLALTGIEAIAPFGIAKLLGTLVQPICKVPKYAAAIADGPADKALGLQTVQKAFFGSTGTWKAAGNGKVTITFKSTDKYDVTVNIYSGGVSLQKHPSVPQGTTVTWTEDLSKLAGKTLYLDRTRPGFLKLPGTGGGSLLVWVPNNPKGELTLTVPISKTSFFDKEPKVTPATAPATAPAAAPAAK